MGSNGVYFIAEISSTISFVISVIVAFFFMGTRWARISELVKSIDHRLARIENQFTLQLRRDKDRDNA